jgi:hypothetical protein
MSEIPALIPLRELGLTQLAHAQVGLGRDNRRLRAACQKHGISKNEVLRSTDIELLLERSSRLENA